MGSPDGLRLLYAICWFHEEDRRTLVENLKGDRDLEACQSIIRDMDMSGFRPDEIRCSEKEKFLYGHWSEASMDIIAKFSKTAKVITTIAHTLRFGNADNIYVLDNELYARTVGLVYGDMLAAHLDASLAAAGDSLYVILSSIPLTMHALSTDIARRIGALGSRGRHVHAKSALGADIGKMLVNVTALAGDFAKVVVLTTDSVLEEYGGAVKALLAANPQVSLELIDSRRIMQDAVRLKTVEVIKDHHCGTRA